MRPQLGLDLAGQHHPDLILLDLHLPDMPGEAVRGFLTKPLDVKELLGLIDGIAAEREQRAAAAR